VHAHVTHNMRYDSLVCSNSNSLPEENTHSSKVNIHSTDCRHSSCVINTPSHQRMPFLLWPNVWRYAACMDWVSSN